MTTENTKYKGQVLIVDDDPIMLELLEANLDEAGFRVSTAKNLTELRQRTHERAFDFVLLDLFLDDESGVEALPYLVHASPYTKVIMMSANGTVELAVDALEKGASSFLAKSKDPKELVKALLEKLGSAQKEIKRKEIGGASLGIIGASPSIQQVFDRIHQVKDVDSTVLINGESGTGKELVARAIHQSSTRAKERFEAVNCGAIAANLLESELFGHKRGAFTDAKADRKGLFEVCDGGTLFLDEIGEMPTNLQVKLLRVLQEREVMPVGSSSTIKVNTRVVAATNKNLADEVKAGNFRTDLYYRLNVLQILLPPLRERTEDIPLLVRFFLDRFNKRFTKSIQPPTKELESRLVSYAWPGNIRELQNAVERGVVLSEDNTLSLDVMLDRPLSETNNVDAQVKGGVQDDAIWMTPLSEAKKNFEKTYLQHLLEITKGNISELSRISGRYRADVYRLMSKYGVEWEEFRKDNT